MESVNEQWTGDVVGKMHVYRISNSELAEKCGITSSYLSMLLNGKKEFSSPEVKQKTIDKVVATLEELINEKNDS